ncbi:MAG: hypothetical protein NUV69_03015 [Candidatus Curtissbacteria bacterium]|nr:hypothetical protein [Candidatus Curtissbacteria bacterium]
MTKLARLLGFGSSFSLFLVSAENVLAQTSAATSSAAKGGTSSSLPSAGSTELTYLIFVTGVLLFVVGTLKFALSYRD